MSERRTWEHVHVWAVSKQCFYKSGNVNWQGKNMCSNGLWDNLPSSEALKLLSTKAIPNPNPNI